jgi:hypothetical protein
MTLLESYQDPRLPQTVRTTPAPAAKPNLSFNGNNCSTAKTRQTLISNTLTYFKNSALNPLRTRKPPSVSPQSFCSAEHLTPRTE